MLGHPGLPAARQLQLIETEHGQSQGDEDQDEPADDPGVLEHGLQVLAEQARQNAGGRVGQGHGQHVNEGQPERPRRGQVFTLAHDDAGQDGHHREYAGRERQQQSGNEKGEQGAVGILDQHPGQPVLLRNRGLGRRIPGRHYPWPANVGRRLRDQQLHARGLRRIADITVPAPLVIGLQGNGLRRARGAVDPDRYLRLAVNHRHRPEFRVVLDLARGQRHLAHLEPPGLGNPETELV